MAGNRKEHEEEERRSELPGLLVEGRLGALPFASPVPGPKN